MDLKSKATVVDLGKVALCYGFSPNNANHASDLSILKLICKQVHDLDTFDLNSVCKIKLTF